MSNYINDKSVLDAIKALIDADSTLDSLLSVRGSSSKVILGFTRPINCNLPVVHLGIVTRTINTETRMNDILLRIMWFVNALPGGTEDIEKMADIGERIYDLLNDSLFTLANYQIMSFAAESGESSALDTDRPEGFENHFQSLTFRLVIKRLA